MSSLVKIYSHLQKVKKLRSYNEYFTNIAETLFMSDK